MAEYAAVVVDKKSWTLLPHGGVAYLLLYPVKCGMCGYIEMNNLSTLKLHDDKDVNRDEKERELNHEVTAPYGRCVILEESAPSLRVSR